MTLRETEFVSTSAGLRGSSCAYSSLVRVARAHQFGGHSARSCAKPMTPTSLPEVGLADGLKFSRIRHKASRGPVRSGTQTSRNAHGPTARFTFIRGDDVDELRQLLDADSLRGQSEHRWVSHGTIVDSTPTLAGPPSRTMSSAPIDLELGDHMLGGSGAHSAESVGARAAIPGACSPAAASPARTSWKHGCGCPQAMADWPPVRARSTVSAFGTTMVSGPGQKASARMRAPE